MRKNGIELTGIRKDIVLMGCGIVFYIIVLMGYVIVFYMIGIRGVLI